MCQHKCKRFLLLIPLVFIIVEALVFQHLLTIHKKNTIEYQLGIKAELINVLAGGNYDLRIIKGLTETEDRQVNTIGRLYDKNKNLVSEVTFHSDFELLESDRDKMSEELLLPFDLKVAQGQFTLPSYNDIKVQFGKIYDNKLDKYLILLGMSETSVTKFEEKFKTYVYTLLIGSFILFYVLIGVYIYNEDKFRDFKRSKEVK